MATCVVSGSASGIGAGTRERLESDGHRVIGIDLRDAEVEADLSVPEGRAAAIRATLEQCEGRIDRLVLSAGVGEMVPIHLVTSVNYFGSIVLLDAFQAALSQGEKSAVVALCSITTNQRPFGLSKKNRILFSRTRAENSHWGLPSDDAPWNGESWGSASTRLPPDPQTHHYSKALPTTPFGVKA